MVEDSDDDDVPICVMLMSRKRNVLPSAAASSSDLSALEARDLIEGGWYDIDHATPVERPGDAGLHFNVRFSEYPEPEHDEVLPAVSVRPRSVSARVRGLKEGQYVVCSCFGADQTGEPGCWHDAIVSSLKDDVCELRQVLPPCHTRSQSDQCTVELGGTIRINYSTVRAMVYVQPPSACMRVLDPVINDNDVGERKNPFVGSKVIVIGSDSMPGMAEVLQISGDDSRCKVRVLSGPLRSCVRWAWYSFGGDGAEADKVEATIEVSKKPRRVYDLCQSDDEGMLHHTESTTSSTAASEKLKTASTANSSGTKRTTLQPKSPGVQIAESVSRDGAMAPPQPEHAKQFRKKRKARISVAASPPSSPCLQVPKDAQISTLEESTLSMASSESDSTLENTKFTLQKVESSLISLQRKLVDAQQAVEALLLPQKEGDSEQKRVLRAYTRDIEAFGNYAKHMMALGSLIMESCEIRERAVVGTDNLGLMATSDAAPFPEAEVDNAASIGEDRVADETMEAAAVESSGVVSGPAVEAGNAASIGDDVPAVVTTAAAAVESSDAAPDTPVEARNVASAGEDEQFAAAAAAVEKSAVAPSSETDADRVALVGEVGARAWSKAHGCAHGCSLQASQSRRQQFPAPVAPTGPEVPVVKKTQPPVRRSFSQREAGMHFTPNQLANAGGGDKPKLVLPVASFCCGAGGIDLGAEAAVLHNLPGYRFSTRWCNDIERDCIATMQRNFRGCHGVAEPMSTFLQHCKERKPRYPQPGEAFLGTVGLPCQGISEANFDRRPTDSRNLLFKDFFEIVRYLQFPYVLVEEVPGFLHEKQVDLDAVKSQMSDMSKDFSLSDCNFCDQCATAFAVAYEHELKEKRKHDGEDHQQSSNDSSCSQPTLTQQLYVSRTTCQECIGNKDPRDPVNRRRYGQTWLQAWRGLFPDQEVPMLIPGKELINLLESAGYKCSVGIHQAAHFGVPQKRQRGIILAAKVESGWQLPRQPEPTHRVDRPFSSKAGEFNDCKVVPLSPNQLKSAKTIGEALEGLPEEVDPFTEALASTNHFLPKTHLGDVLKHVRPGECITEAYERLWTGDCDRAFSFRLHFRGSRKILEHLPNILDETRTKPSVGFRRRFTRPSPTDLSRTIITKLDRPNELQFAHPVFDRLLTVREAARLQTVPDTHIFCVHPSLCSPAKKIESMYKQVGNMVPCCLAEALCKQILIAGAMSARQGSPDLHILTSSFKAGGLLGQECPRVWYS